MQSANHLIKTFAQTFFVDIVYDRSFINAVVFAVWNGFICGSQPDRRVKMKLGTLIISVVIAVAIGMMGIGGAQAADVVKLKVLIGNWAVKTLTPAFETFTKETGIEIEAEDLPFRDLLKKIEVYGHAGAKDVDVIFVDAPLTPSYAERGLILPVTKYFSDADLKQLWAPAALGSAMWKGELWAPPLNNSSQVMYYNKDLLDAAGIAHPSIEFDKRMTWKEVVENAQKVTDTKAGVWGLLFDQISRYYQLQPLAESLGGGSGVSEDGMSVKGRLTNEGWIKAFTFYGDLFNKWNISPKGVTATETRDVFANGKLAYYVGGPWRTPLFKKSGVNYGLAPHPYFAGSKPATSTNSWHMGVWKHTAHPDEAGKLVRYLTANPKVAISAMEIDGRLPSHNSALLFITEQPRFKNSVYALSAYEAVNTAVIRGRTPAYLEFEELVNNALEDIRNGGDPMTVFSETESRITSTMRRYKK
jgi:ABC-type glycerol-3-phosphate transport system substrate-binding protein